VPKYKVVILEQAISDLVESCHYYNDKVSGLGNEFEDEVFNLLEIIKENPLIFPIKYSTIHEAVLLNFPFVINYEVNGNQIIVYAVFHSKRNPAKKPKRKRK
jgi:hypothetical protein